VFLKDMWTVARAKTWLKGHGYKYGTADTSPPNTIRFRQQDPRRFERFAMQPLGTSNPSMESVIPVKWAEAKVRQVAGKIQVMVFGKKKIRS
jgi:hypothetical protein